MDERVNHGKAICMKALMVFAVAWVILSLLNNVTFMHSTLLGITLLLLSYFTGDMFILPKMGNRAAMVGDFVLSLVIIWGGLNVLGYDHAFAKAVLALVIICTGEYFFHLWLLRTQFKETRAGQY